MEFCFALSPKPFSKWLPIRNNWGPGLVFLQSYTLGLNVSNTTRTSIVWCQPADYLRTDKGGSHPRKKRFFLPVKPLSHLFRGKFLAFLEEAFAAHSLSFHGRIRELAHPVRFAELLSALCDKDWVVYAKPPFGGPQHVLQYLARYTHRVAVSNGRLLNLENGRVHFRWRDSQDRNRIKEMSLGAIEFIRRFLLHVLPSGFVKIRHFGFLSNRSRKKMVQHCRELLPPSSAEVFVMEPHLPLCPVCKVGHLLTIEWQRQAAPAAAAPPHSQVPTWDSS